MCLPSSSQSTKSLEASGWLSMVRIVEAYTEPATLPFPTLLTPAEGYRCVNEVRLPRTLADNTSLSLPHLEGFLASSFIFASHNMKFYENISLFKKV